MQLTDRRPALHGSPDDEPVVVSTYSGDQAEWDRFVRRTSGGSFFHQIGWKDVIERTFGFHAHYLVARRAGALAGVLPLFVLRRPWSRPHLLSLPFAVEGGVCSADGDARRALDAAALRLAEDVRAGSIELRDGLEGERFEIREGLYYGFRREILPTDDENLAAIRRKQRRMVRVGQQSGLVSRVTTEDLDVFYDLYARSVRHLGTPVFPRRYFRALLDRFGDDCVVLTVRQGETPVAAVMSFFFNDTVLPYYAGSRTEFFRYAPNDFMYWELMCYARARGARVFDFGRSKKGTGAFDFKCHWGFEPQPMRYRCGTFGAAPSRQRSTSDRHLQLLRSVWQRVPLSCTKLLGPFFIRHFGAYYT